MTTGSEDIGAQTAGDTCPTCGTALQQATVDLADRPDHPDGVDVPRAEFDPNSMVAVAFCPNPDCPSHA